MRPLQFTDNDRIRVVRIPLLGGMSASSFLRRHWQKNPLLVRDAIPGFEGVIDLRGVIELAGRDDCETRLVLRAGRRWTVEHGPFARRFLSSLPQRNWTLLVQGVESPPARRTETSVPFRFHSSYPPGRSHGELRAARRRSRTAFRLLRRFPAARFGPATLEGWPAGRPDAGGWRATENPQAFRAAGRVRARSGRHALSAARIRA